MRNTQSNNNYMNNGDVNQSIDKSRTIIKGNRTQIVIIGVIVVGIILALILMFKSNSPEKKIIGTWQMNGSDKLYEFTRDKQFIYLSGSNEGMTITYSIDGDRIKLNASVLWANATVFADVNISGTTLELSNFSDPDGLFNVDADDIWIFSKKE